MAEAGISTHHEQALVRLDGRPRPAALYRIPFSLTLLGLFLISFQAGRPLVGLGVLLAALVASATVAWRSLARRQFPALMLREKADAQLVAGRYDNARQLYEKALTIVQRELPASAPELLVHYYSLAAVNSMLGDHAKADQYLAQLLRGIHFIEAPWTGHVAWLLRRVAHHHCMQGRHAHAIRLCERALALVGDAPGADDNTVRSILDDLAWIEHQAGDYASAERLFRSALAIHEQFRDVVRDLGSVDERIATSESPYRMPGPPTTSSSGGLDEAVAYSLLGLGWTVYERGRYEEARLYFERAAAVADTTSIAMAARRDPSIADRGPGLRAEAQRGRAAVQMTLGQYAKAEVLYRNADCLTPHGSSSMGRVALLIDLAWLARSRERFDEADILYRRALQALDADHDGASVMECALFEGRAELNRRRGHHEQAKNDATTAERLARQILGADHPRTAAIVAILSRVHTGAGDVAEGDRLARRALDILRARLDDGHVRFADAHIAVGEVYLAREEFAAASTAFSEALTLRSAVLGPDHPELAEILDNQVLVWRALGEDAEAADAETRARSLRDRAAA